MNQITDQLSGAFVQCILFLALPFLWWCLTGRKETFFKWLGVKKVKTDAKPKLILGGGLGLFAFSLLGYFTLQAVPDTSMLANGGFTSFDVPALGAVLVYSFIKTAFTEEVFFRGFLGKRLIQRFGFGAGNLLQSSVFGLVHGVLLAGALDNSLLVILIACFTGLIGFALGYLNERQAGGSIMAGWLIHGLANLGSSLALMSGWV